MKPKLSTLLLTAILVMTTSQANALTFTKTGKIVRTLLSSSFGGCMIMLDTPIGNSCSNWVSLDCKALTTPLGDGNRYYASALLAVSLNKQVTIFLDNTKKIDSVFCVPTRLDTIF